MRLYEWAFLGFLHLSQAAEYSIDSSCSQCTYQPRLENKENQQRSGSGITATKAATVSSDTFAYSDWFKATKINDIAPPLSDYKVEMPNLAYTIDICTWFSDQANSGGWSTINAPWVAMVTTDKNFREKVAAHKLLPVDGVKTFGTTVLHELKHTNQGGQAQDVK
ncbi:hypothetical protein BJ170DRAFT_736002 [Xylariales sp. AK1849]|nr:hypothetical protein BJ170DRAFT_736002 [Xylariales sp. AK1849]